VTEPLKSALEHAVLITNLLDALIDTPFGKVRMRANALVLFDRGSKSSGPRYRIHGFYNEAANLTFDMVLPSFDWSIETQSYKRSFTLVVAGSPSVKIELHTDFANDEPLDIERWDMTDENRDAWSDALLRKVLRYYHAPYIVLGQQFETDVARLALGVESVEKLRGTS
jgi:hypothetical protein